LGAGDINVAVAARMWQTITQLVGARGRYISFGATVIYCDANNVCSVRDTLDQAGYANVDAETVVSHE
jgi:hypothetical protein